MSGWKAKRFWTKAEVTPTDAGFGILLDGRPVKTPAKAALVVPTRAFAEAIAAEWDAQDKEVRPLTMPYTRTANAAIDKVTAQHDEVAEMLAAYGDCDLTCYRATGPQELIDRQAAAWDPLLAWTKSELGADLTARAGVIHVPQTASANDILAQNVRQLDSFRLAAFHDLVGISGSLVIGFAVLRGKLTADEGWDLSRVDEEWQIEQWGRDEEADSLAETKKVDFRHAASVIELIKE